MKEHQVQKVIDNLNERMSTHISSFCASDDEVSMALLICHIQDLDNMLLNAFQLVKNGKQISHLKFEGFKELMEKKHNFKGEIE